MTGRLFLVVVCAAASLVSATAEARQGVAGIRGRVTDEQKGVLPGATVTATHRESGIARETISGSDGTFSVPSLVPGPYRLEAQLAGFNKYQVEDILLRVGATVQIDCTLQVGGLTESVTVTSEAPQVDLTSTEVGGTVNSARAHQPAVRATATSPASSRCCPAWSTTRRPIPRRTTSPSTASTAAAWCS